MERFDSHVKDYAEDMKYTKRQVLLSRFLDHKSLLAKEEIPEKYSEAFRLSCPNLLEKHRNMLDNVFKMLINNMYPLKQLKYWSVLEENYDRDFKVFTDIRRCSKYKIPEYKEKHKFTLVDDYIASFNPDEGQFQFLKDMVKKEANIKNQYKKALELILKAKLMIEKATSDLYNFGCIMIKSGIIGDEQYLNSAAKDKYLREEDGFTNIWDIKVTPTPYTTNISKDKYVGKYAKQYMKKKDHVNKLTYNTFAIS